ncbi:hypothetical protein B4U37_19605 [Sutcliffiella horikoshii]|uniref:OmpR/PhoB-type domain-containing protein n=1 Tax=Sutcliffiella horikoshii TaxID=79883 RepID=A0ABM6KNZ3_9BACI|nr:winged helix-turn-helix domain-containing protein [Sutcliffiella horikoshii]ART78107.1 hypothetical protein B4U37_19605 [Sutcliffiella horikoshii]
MSVVFNISDYSVMIDGEELKLLRKEFLLLDYLYQNGNKALSRHQLLDAVWPLQVPSDRTVDDHVYRLRKKLKKWEHALKLETVKGFGYKLTVFQQKEFMSFPFVEDQEFQQLTINLISKYHLFGHGEAIEELLSKHTFGIEIDEKLLLVMKLLRGDFKAFLHSPLPFKEKALPLLFLYSTVEEDIHAINYYYRIFEDKQLFENEGKEEIDFFKILLCLKEKNFRHAFEILEATEKTISLDVPGFYGFFQVNWLAYAIGRKDWKLAEDKIKCLHAFFKDKPYQREYGLFLMLKGIYFLHQKRKSLGVDLISQSFHVLEKTKFVMHTLISILVAGLLQGDLHCKEAEEIILLKKNEVFDKYQLIPLKKQIKTLFDSVL